MPRSRILPAEPVKIAVNAEITAGSKETSQIFLPSDASECIFEAVSENEPKNIVITSEEKIEKSEPAQVIQSPKPKPTTPSSEPRMGDVRIVNGKKQIYIDGFGWIKDEGGGSHGTMAGNSNDELTGNKVGQMGGGTTVHGKGDINKQVGIMGAGDVPPSNTDPVPGTKEYIGGKLHVWMPGFGWIEYRGKQNIGIVAEDMYENGHKIGSMGGSEVPPRESTPPASGQLEPIDGEFHIVFVEVPEKNSTPPPYNPDTVSP
ncbi:DUF6550 family protein [Paradesulfitobacterium aromaticivorans]